MHIHQDMKTGSDRPIGYWLKHLDRLIEDTFRQALAGQGLTRRHWQVLNTTSRGPASPAELAEALDPFLRDDPAGQASAVADLIDRGWVNSDHDGRLCLTPHGRAAHQTTQQQVQQTRRLMLRGISAGEYAAVIDILTRMAANLQGNDQLANKQ
jgi:DNA-binding MarR family transcriptional regulator